MAVLKVFDCFLNYVQNLIRCGLNFCQKHQFTWLQSSVWILQYLVWKNLKGVWKRLIKVSKSLGICVVFQIIRTLYRSHQLVVVMNDSQLIYSLGWVNPFALWILDRALGFCGHLSIVSLIYSYFYKSLTFNVSILLQCDHFPVSQM